VSVAGPRAIPLSEVRALTEERIPTGVSELDRVLGGGIVPGSLVLIGGEPGIGKSTLVLQALAHMSTSRPALLVTGEESPAQVRARAQRLTASCDAIIVYPETRLEAIAELLEASPPGICAIDSVQTLTSDSLDSAPGSPAQVRHVTAELVRIAKSRDIAMILVGQVTKDGGLAGPRLLEHLVDAVISFEGDGVRAQRVLRALKNRFGSTNETGILEMRTEGLVSVDDPSDIYLAEAGERVGTSAGPDTHVANHGAGGDVRHGRSAQHGERSGAAQKGSRPCRRGTTEGCEQRKRRQHPAHAWRAARFFSHP
jgi:DNA repair protein RadA/Sms